MKYACIDRCQERYSIQLMCRLLSVSRSGYYASKTRPKSTRSKADLALADKIKKIHTESGGVYGSPKIKSELEEDGYTVGRHKVAKLMRMQRIRGIPKRHHRTTTKRDPRHNVAKNKLKQNFTADQPNQVWVSDITYITTNEGWLFLAVVIDLYSRRVVGWSMSRRQSRRIVVDALTMAVNAREPESGLVHHSDRGAQYTSEDLQEVLRRNKIECSMSSNGNCYDNAVAESFFGLLKRERANRKRYRTREEARKDIFDYIEVFYNRKRRHSYVGNVSPTSFEESTIGSL